MANLISELKFTLSAGTEKQELTPLRELLMVQKANKKDIKTQETKASKSKDDNQDILKSRRASRKQRKSKSSPQNFTSPNSPKVVANIRAAQIERIQSSNNAALIELQKSIDNQDAAAKTQAGAPESGNFVADFDRSFNEEVNEETNNKIPVILSMVDFLPCFDGDIDSPTAAFTSLEFKRAIRMLNLDVQTPDANSSVMRKLSNMREVPIAAALVEYLRSKKAFVDKLDINTANIDRLNEIFATLMLTDRSASTTELLFVLIRDYANSLMYASPRLTESSERFLEQDLALPEFPYSIAKDIHERAAKEWSRRPLAMITNVLSDDAELMVKTLANLVGKETFFSENIVKNNDTFSAPGSKELNKNMWDPFELLNVWGSERRLQTQWIDQGKTGRGVLFKNFISSKSAAQTRSNTSANFPYEKKRILFAGAGTSTQLSAPDYARKVYEDLGSSDVPVYPSASGNNFSSPYAATLDSFEFVGEKIGRLTLPTGDSSILKPLLKVLDITIRNLEVVPYSLYYSIQLKIFELAASNENMLRKLLIYLAFRQEKKLGYTGIGPAPDGPSKCLRKSRWLQDELAWALKGRGKIIKTQTISPSNVTINPAIDGQSSIRAPSRTTTIGIEIEGSESDAGNLEAMYGLTFEEVADAMAEDFFYELASAAPSDFATKLGPLSSSEGDGYDMEVSLNGVKNALNTTDDSRALTEDLFDCMINYGQYLNGNVGPQIYSLEGKSYFSSISREVIYSLFVYLTCKVQKLVTSKMLVTRGNTATAAAAYSMDTGKQVKFTPPPSSSTNKFKLRKLNGWESKISLLKAWSSDPAKVTSSLSTSFPEISRIFSDLTEEQTFLMTMNYSMNQYFRNISRKYSLMVNSMDMYTSDGSTLGEKLKSGIIPSIDVVKLLSQYPYKLNSEALNYYGKKVDDNTIAEAQFSFLQKVLSSIPDMQEKDQGAKILSIGIPAGALESMEEAPVPLDEITQQSIVRPEIFDLVVQKIDQTQPNVEFEELRFPFSRSLFSLNPTPAGMDFTIVSDDLRLQRVSEEVVYRLFDHKNENSLGQEVVKNHSIDYALKQYLDLQYDLDLEEDAFSMNEDVLNDVLSTEIKIEMLRPKNGMNFSSLQFLSSSNLAFDPEKIPFKSLEFFNEKNGTIDISKKSYDDPYKYSALDYVNTYGSVFNSKKKLIQLGNGTIFEKTLCVLFHDSDFDIKSVRVPSDDYRYRDMSEESIAIARKEAEKRAWEKASMTTESTPTKMITYRVYLSLTDKNIVGEGGYSN